MRALSWWMLLVACFAAAALIHARWTDEQRATRARAWSRESERTMIAGGWSRVVVGRPSGAAPTDEPPVRETPGRDLPDSDTAAATDGAGQPASGHTAGPARDASRDPDRPGAGAFELKVASGQTLSQICESFYGTSDAALVKRLARFNGMADADHLRAGDDLRLPEREVLDAID